MSNRVGGSGSSGVLWIGTESTFERRGSVAGGVRAVLRFARSEGEAPVNVIFHALTSTAVMAAASGVEAESRSSRRLRLAGAFGAGLCVHGVLDGLPHQYPLPAAPDVVAALALVALVGLLSRPSSRALLVASFSGAIAPDVVDLGPSMLASSVTAPLRHPLLFPWHWREGSGSIYDGRHVVVSITNHVIVVALSLLVLWASRSRWRKARREGELGDGLVEIPEPPRRSDARAQRG